MENNLNKHIDAKVKQSFDSFQKTAPLQLWQTISEQLDAEQSLDKQIDQKIETTYQNEVKGTAPALVWNAIEEELDLDALVDEKVKGSFENNIVQRVPVSLWSSISNDLDDKMPPIDPILDEKVKTSFLEQEEIKTPRKVWFAINRQLNIDKTWNNISKVLDANPIVSDWRKQMLQFITVAVLLLCFVRTCDYKPYPEKNSTFAVNQTIETLQNNKEKKKPAVVQEHQKKEAVVVTIQEKEQQEKSNQASSSFDNSKKELVEAVTPSKKSALKKKEKATNSVSSVTKRKTKTELSVHKSKGKGAATIENTSEESLIEQAASGTINKVAVDKTKEIGVLAAENATVATPNWALLEAIRLGQLLVDSKTEPIQLVDDLVLTKPIKKNPIEGKLEAGAFIVVNSTMLLNNETREGFDANSLTTNYFGLAANYGIWTAYKVTPKGSIVAEFSINADNKQAYGTYEKGLFYIKEWVMKYNRLSVAYKHDLWSSDSDKLINTKVVAQGGIYVGLMREAKLFYDGVLVFDKLADYHQFDFGLKLALGQELLIDKFVIGYGIRSDVGLTNIFRGNVLLNAQENQTNIIHLGGYVLLGYRF